MGPEILISNKLPSDDVSGEPDHTLGNMDIERLLYHEYPPNFLPALSGRPVGGVS